MSNKHLHIVSFDVPFPADYGGVIDVFYKIRALSQAGYQISLHCFEYGRGVAEELNNYCREVYYYPRKIHKKYLFSRLPFIVASRRSQVLLQRLCSDNSPILFEGLHTCAYLGHSALANRLKLVRCHNVEHDYYKGLAEAEESHFRRSYFRFEARKLKRFEQILSYADVLLTVSAGDTAYFEERYGRTHLVTSFQYHDQVVSKNGKGEYALYHGNLSVAENNKAALFLVNQVFSLIDYPLVILGKNPSSELRDKVEQLKHVVLREHASDAETYDLIANAQMNVLPTFQATGIKLKLLNSLFAGRHCIVNVPMVIDTGLEELCHVCDSPQSFIDAIKHFGQVSLTQEEIRKRKKLLESEYANGASLSVLEKLLFQSP